MVELHEKALTKIDFSAKIWNFALKPLPRFVFENKKRTLSAHPFIAYIGKSGTRFCLDDAQIR